ncbi:thiamine biosynthesis lipoprotein [Formivibrio citricus]|uniref:FAD:protein FMN transferase n=1 Tax=Formivibrio citricus TaxID=83765 RepID=A0A1I4VJY8_9NEIS|nr:FAD:protein FMN transferase [Formivibrio citricus]SFN01430.1 thiamine biosynthesis lipoprotein [Formivibrio citricus]
MMRRFLVLLVALLLPACSKPALYQQESYVFGTRVVISVWGAPENQAREATAAALGELDRLHAKLHAWRPSEVLHLNEAFARGESATVDDELAGMLKQAARYARQSDELFNPAVGQLVALWGFHRDTFEPVTADPKAVAALLAARPSLEDLRFDGAKVSSRNRAVAIDLGGYAKGWALDRVAGILRSKGVNNALINIGGNVMALGRKNAERWKIGLQHPRKPAAMASIELNDGEAIGTSGDYQRYFEKDGQRYSHIIDPRTGKPAQILQAATVIAPAGKEAGTISDIATKPLYIGGKASAPRFAERFGIRDYLLIDPQGAIFASPSMLSRIAWLEKPDTIATLQ